MRETISRLAAAIALVAASAVPAFACGYGCCGPAYVSPCTQTYVPAVGYAYSGCGGCGWAYERLADPATQYYFVNQGPTYTGPGAFAPYPTYEGAVLYRHAVRYYKGQRVLRRYY